MGDYEVRIRDGSKYYCRSDLQTGSRVMMVATCLTEAQYVIMQDETRQTLDRMRGTRPTGGSSSSGAN